MLEETSNVVECISEIKTVADYWKNKDKYLNFAQLGRTGLTELLSQKIEGCLVADSFGELSRMVADKPYRVNLLVISENLHVDPSEREELLMWLIENGDVRVYRVEEGISYMLFCTTAADMADRFMEKFAEK
jgi:hypothetical protein